ncbi:gag-proteinase polyprotein [Cucumis melo var. makuwa]|uniref:Gag-proteinase polyprotein n=1 Tax=Cucumis melo var. makuwa TaxID=1194695 RepID=A0A5D3DTR6_CUCMM|nr:gag-proteinase polyprotein [Cucumis melo var. makuwa]
MESQHEGCATNKPPLLDGTNYGYWKARMMVFLKSLDLNCWRVVMVRWQQPMKTSENGVVTQKTELKWLKPEDEVVVGNCQALNALFNAVDPHVFKLINTCTPVKEAWDILEVVYEGSSKVKTSQLQILMSQIEGMKMREDQTISEYNVKILDIANETFLLGERIPESKLLRKVLCSLP